MNTAPDFRGGPVPVLEIGGTHVTAALVEFDPDGGPLVGRTRRSDLLAAESAEKIVQRIAACARALNAQELGQWGVALPGPFDYARGVGLYKNVGKFDALYGVDLRDLLLRRLPSRPADVIFLNDAEAFLSGEWAAGAARGHDRAVGLTLGTGIGSAFFAEGKPITAGPQVPPHGSVHLLSVGGSLLEDVVSSRAIRRRYAAAAGGLQLEVHEIARRARDGEPTAHEAVRGPLTELGRTLAPWLARFEATIVVVGGSIARSWDLVADPLQAGICAASPVPSKVSVVPARHPEFAPLIGVGHKLLSLGRA